MIEFGKTLRAAREAKGLTTGQIAERTHMMVQTVEGLENENFSKIVAPIYGRGFVNDIRTRIRQTLLRDRRTRSEADGGRVHGDIRRQARGGGEKPASEACGNTRAGLHARTGPGSVQARRRRASAEAGGTRLRSPPPYRFRARARRVGSRAEAAYAVPLRGEHPRRLSGTELLAPVRELAPRRARRRRFRGPPLRRARNPRDMMRPLPSQSRRPQSSSPSPRAASPKPQAVRPRPRRRSRSPQPASRCR